jgi:hypothetical protein
MIYIKYFKNLLFIVPLTIISKEELDYCTMSVLKVKSNCRFLNEKWKFKIELVPCFKHKTRRK